MKTKNEELAVAVVEDKKEVSTEVASWGAMEDLGLAELAVPFIKLVQKTTKEVDTFGSKPGTFINSLDGEVVGTNEDPLEIIIFGAYMSWLVMKTPLNSDQSEFVKFEPLTVENANLRYEEMTPEGKITRHRTINYYCIDRKHVVDGIPAVISFNKKALKVGQRLGVIFSKLARIGKTSAHVVIKLTSQFKDEGALKKWYEPVATISRDATPEEVAAAKYWYDQTNRLVATESNSATEDKDPWE